VRIEFRMAEGRIERLPALATELVRAKVDVIVAGGTVPSLEAARRATTVIPIVMIAMDYITIPSSLALRTDRLIE
jgi:putative ABC transport system substrate-binding protein